MVDNDVVGRGSIPMMRCSSCSMCGRSLGGMLWEVFGGVDDELAGRPSGLRGPGVRTGSL